MLSLGPTGDKHRLSSRRTTLSSASGTGKSHMLVALGHAAVEAEHRVRYFTAAELVETLYRVCLLLSDKGAM